MANETLFRAVDDSFGPFFDPYQGAFFDFTLLFEETILSIAPSVLLLLAVPLRILWLLRQSRKVKLGPLRSTKIVSLKFLQIKSSDQKVTSGAPGTAFSPFHSQYSKSCDMDNSISTTYQGIHSCRLCLPCHCCCLRSFVIFGAWSVNTA
jgi:hypothetical protein